VLILHPNFASREEECRNEDEENSAGNEASNRVETNDTTTRGEDEVAAIFAEKPTLRGTRSDRTGSRGKRSGVRIKEKHGFLPGNKFSLLIVKLKYISIYKSHVACVLRSSISPLLSLSLSLSLFLWRSGCLSLFATAAKGRDHRVSAPKGRAAFRRAETRRIVRVSRDLSMDVDASVNIAKGYSRLIFAYLIAHQSKRVGVAFIHPSIPAASVFSILFCRRDHALYRSLRVRFRAILSSLSRAPAHFRATLQPSREGYRRNETKRNETKRNGTER